MRGVRGMRSGGVGGGTWGRRVWLLVEIHSVLFDAFREQLARLCTTRFLIPSVCHSILGRPDMARSLRASSLFPFDSFPFAAFPFAA